MINKVVFDNQIKLWWDYVKLEKGCSFKVLKNGEVFYTTNYHYCFKDLSAETDYNFSVELVNDGLEIIDKIGDSIVKTLKKKNFIDVTQAPYFAKGDGVTLNTEALQSAINDCTKGDLVYFPDGVFLTGALDLHSDVELRLSDGAVLQGTVNEKDYLPKINSRFEGISEVCYRSLLNCGVIDHKGGFNCENIIISGGKILSGGNELRLNQISAERDGILKQFGLESDPNPPAYYKSFLPGRRRGRLFHFVNTKNILIADTFVGNSPSWNVHTIYCENVTICNSTIFSHKISNGDGFDPDSTSNCVVFGMTFDTGDDCVAIKSGRNKEGEDVGRPTKDVKIFDSVSVDGHGLAIGSEMSGGVENVTVWNCDLFYSAKGINIKTNRDRGGYIKNVKMYNFISRSINIDVYKGGNDDGEPAKNFPILENFHFEDFKLCGVSLTTGKDKIVLSNALFFNCPDEYHAKNVTLKNITLLNREVVPYQDFIINNIDNLTFENIVAIGDDINISPYKKR